MAPRVLYSVDEIKAYSDKYSVVRVLNVETNAGQTIHFHENYPASVTPKGIKGKPLVHIDYIREKSLIMNEADNEILQVITDENRRYNVISTDRKGYVCANYDYITIPYNDVNNILVTTANVAGDYYYFFTFWDFFFFAHGYMPFYLY